jgi:hypothetical protein
MVALMLCKRLTLVFPRGRVLRNGPGVLLTAVPFLGALLKTLPVSRPHLPHVYSMSVSHTHRHGNII